MSNRNSPFDKILIICLVLTILTTCASNEDTPETRRKHGSSPKIHLTGIVLDQYGNPAASARVFIAYLYRKQSGAGFTETDYVIADENGHFNYQPENRYHTGFCIGTAENIDFNKGIFYSGGPQTIYEIRDNIGWVTDTPLTHDTETGWDNHFVQKKVAAPIILRANRSGTPESLIEFEWSRVKGEKSGVSFGIDMTTGEKRPLPCPDCDFTMKFSWCPPIEGKSAAAGGIKEITAMKSGGILVYDQKKMSQIEAPIDGYRNKVRLIPNDCKITKPATDYDYIENPHSRPEFFFKSRSGYVYGYVEIRDSYFSQDGADRKFTGDWGTMAVTANPRGHRTLTRQNYFIDGKPQQMSPVIQLPITIPYQDPPK